ncbi:pre-mRNA-processing factor 17 [Daphnia magna]|uniref:Pre-mRNA-processing factor 17 n=2 Tax=Daphnia magna TaxID=35525 RepID=A0ABR0ALR1_9CRUS|nr:pre-mRNA-processing factor 17 [Daphnia magna]KAK4026056.1 hypothetical protein OUZ56_015082 [Daphnia magna]
MASVAALREYGSSDDDSGSGEDSHLNPINTTELINQKLIVPVTAAPDVLPNEELDPLRHVDPSSKELLYNPKAEELFAPTLGPDCPFKTGQQRAHRNTVAGFVEPAHLSEFQFEAQRKTFTSFGYALDPTVGLAQNEGSSYVGDIESAESSSGRTVFENPNRPDPSRAGVKRKIEKNDDSADLEGYKGPWAPYENESRSAKPSEADKEELDAYLAKMKKRGKPRYEEKAIEEKTSLHIDDPVDYQGRNFLHAPHDIGINLRSDAPPNKCFIPKKQIHAWAGHNKGVAQIRWFPKTAHLLLSCSMDGRVKIWEVYKDRRCVRTYFGHRQAVRDISFNNSGEKFLSAAYDRYIKLWDTETGQVISRFTNKKVPYCVKFNPEEDKQHLFVAGMADKKIVCWDTRTGEAVQEYDRHLGAVNTITFVDENRRFVSTSDDKSLRVWEWDIPVDMKYIADPTMHSMPAVTLAPNLKWLGCQSMDNKIVIYSALNRFKLNRKKTFKGHMVAGYACGLDFSPEMSYVISGDADGKVFVWDWKTTRVLARWKAHQAVCSSVLWHPHETSKIASAGWDGLIKFWD